MLKCYDYDGGANAHDALRDVLTRRKAGRQMPREYTRMKPCLIPESRVPIDKLRAMAAKLITTIMSHPLGGHGQDRGKRRERTIY